MNLKKLFLSFSILILLLSLFSCSNSHKPAIGNNDDIIVFADSLLYNQLEAEMLHVFEKIIYTPQPENLFNLQRENFREIRKLQNRKNIIFLGVLDSNDNTSRYIKASLDSTVVELVRKNEVSFINKNNLWAKNQLVMFLVSNTVDELREKILKNNEPLLYSFTHASNKRLFSQLYKPNLELKDVKAEILSKFGWTMFIEPDITLAKSDSVNNFVWLRSGRNSPIERWTFVHWIENANAKYLNKDSLVNIRNRVTRKHYRVIGDTVSVEIAFGMSAPKVTETNFNDRYALMSQGFWKFNDKSGGGPFISYSFLDEKSGRFYMIDASIFAPRYYKKNLLQRADVILTSFRTSDELSEEKIENILDELK